MGAEKVIRRAIARSGRITFARYMELALYHPRWGYYSQRARLGAGGDFYTSPELHPFFAAAVAARAEALWLAMARPDVFDLVEVGGGSGRFAADFLRYVEMRKPEFFRSLRYRIDDRGAVLRSGQRQELEKLGLAEHVTWTDGSVTDWSAGSIAGLIVANELLDAFPVHLVTNQSGRLVEHYVVERGGALGLEPGPPSTPRLERYFRDLGLVLPEGVRAEVNVAATTWLRRAAKAVASGGMLLIDYGYPARDLYAANRSAGTLLCYSEHRMSSDPLEHPGLQDITCHIDLTTTLRTLDRVGMSLVEGARQSDALARSGLTAWRDWTQRRPGSWSSRAGELRSLDALIDPTGLGAVHWLLLSTAGLRTPLEGATIAAPPPGLDVDFGEHLVLPDPMTLDPITDIEGQWRELWEDEEQE